MFDPLLADLQAPAAWDLTAPHDLARLRADRVLLEAENVARELALEDARADYALRDGTATLDDLTDAERAHDEATRRLHAHNAVIHTVEAQVTAAEREATDRALTEELERLRDDLTRTEAEEIGVLEEAERLLHAARLRSRELRDRARELRSHGRQLLARREALRGQPSPAVASLSIPQAHEHEAKLGLYRLSESDKPDRMAEDAVTTPNGADEAHEQHARRWSAALSQVSSWPTPKSE